MDLEYNVYTEGPLPKIGQMCLFTGMGALMIMAKPFTEDQVNYGYLTKRWDAFIAKTGLADRLKIGVAKDLLKTLLTAFSSRISVNRPLRIKFVKVFLRLHFEGVFPRMWSLTPYGSRFSWYGKATGWPVPS